MTVAFFWRSYKPGESTTGGVKALKLKEWKSGLGLVLKYEQYIKEKSIETDACGTFLLPNI